MKEKGNRVAAIENLLVRFCGILLGIAVSIVMYEIVSRVFFHTSYAFLISGPVWIVIWVALLASGITLKEGGHVAVGFIHERLKGKLLLSIDAVNSLSVLVYGVLITWGGVVMIRTYYIKGAAFSRYFSFPYYLVELCVPIGVLIFTIYAIRDIFRVVHHNR